MSFQFSKYQSMCGLFLHKSHYMSKSRIVRVKGRAGYFCASFLHVKCQKLAKTLSNMHTIGHWLKMMCYFSQAFIGLVCFSSKQCFVAIEVQADVGHGTCMGIKYLSIPKLIPT